MMLAAVSWSPNPLAPHTQSTLRISFYDPTGTQPLANTNVKYNLIIFDKNNHAVITKQNLLANNATDIQAIVFPAKEIYHMVVVHMIAECRQTSSKSNYRNASYYIG